jgi:Optic atrophy 3 protein (OPA3)
VFVPSFSVLAANLYNFYNGFIELKVVAAQKLHRLDVRVSRGAEGSSGRAFVGELTEEKAVELAGKVVSEGFVYTVRL